MSNNILIVESKNDKHFFKALIKHLNIDITIDKPILLDDDDYKEMDGLNKTKLEGAFKDLKADIQKKAIERVGVVIDIDQYQESQRIQFTNECIQNVFPGTPPLTRTNELINLNFDDFDIKLACYFTGVNGQGELETVLKEIKSQDSIYADCLESWKTCLQSNGKGIPPKEFDKFWVNNYIRFDTCSDNEKKQAGRKCSMQNFDYIMENKACIWNFDHAILNDMKMFLQLFS